MVTSGRLLADVQGAVHDAACGALDSHAGDDDVVQGLGQCRLNSITSFSGETKAVKPIVSQK